MYSVQWYYRGKYNMYMTDSWSQAKEWYDQMYWAPDIENLRIKDNEYGIYYIDYHWERDSNLLGWAGGEQ